MKIILEKLTVLKAQVVAERKKWFWFISALGVILLGWFPYLLTVNEIPLIIDPDWGYFFLMQEGVRKSLVEYGQFPFWLPWHQGGLPLFSHPHTSLFSFDTVFVVLFGTVTGLRLAVMFNVLLGAAGMWFLLKHLKRSAMLCFWGTILFGLQGTIAMHITAGHVCMIGIVWLPWLALFGLLSVRRLWAALALGATAGLMMLQYFHYMSIINSLIITVLMLHLWRQNYKNKIFYQNMAAAVLMFATLAAFRIIVTLPLCLQNVNNPLPGLVSISPWLFLKALVWPMQWIVTLPSPWRDFLRWHELGCYVGIIAVVMFFFSMRKGWRWYHSCFLLMVLLTLDSSLPFLPGYWVNSQSAIRVPTRWRFAAVFFLIIGATAGLGMLGDMIKKQRKRVWVCGTLIAVSIAGLIFSQYYNWHHRSTMTQAKAEGLTRIRSKTILTADHPKIYYYSAVRKNIGVKRSFDPLFRQGEKIGIKAFNEPGYRGEISSFPRNITIEKWSANKIVLSASGPSIVAVNQNPGSYWRLNGTVIYPKAKAIESDKEFYFKIPKKGRYILEACPPGFELGLSCTAISAVLLLGYLLFLYKAKNKVVETTAPEKMSE